MLSICRHPPVKIVDKMTSVGREDHRICEFRSFGRPLRLRTMDGDTRNGFFVDSVGRKTATRSYSSTAQAKAPRLGTLRVELDNFESKSIGGELRALMGSCTKTLGLSRKANRNYQANALGMDLISI